jgi:hypothetical protein
LARIRAWPIDCDFTVFTTNEGDDTVPNAREDERGKMKGATQHAEGEHGERTHARFIEQLHEAPANEADNIIARHRDEKHRLATNREQSDEAEKNSERNRQRK